MKLSTLSVELREIIQHRIWECVKWLRLEPYPDRETEPTQRNRYLSNFELAIRFDAIEQGVLPVVQALYELGTNTQFSCEGHQIKDRIRYPYVVCWLNPELATTLPSVLEKVLLAPLHYHWYVEMEDSRKSKLACQETGEPGLFLALRWDGRPHRLLPASGKFTPWFIKEWVNADLAEIAQRLNALDLPRRSPADKTEAALMTRVFLTFLLAPPLVLLTALILPICWAYKAYKTIDGLRRKPLPGVGKWVRRLFMSRTSTRSTQPGRNA